MKFFNRPKENKDIYKLEFWKNYSQSLEENPKPDQDLAYPHFHAHFEKKEQAGLKKIFKKLVKFNHSEQEPVELINIWAQSLQDIINRTEKENNKPSPEIIIKTSINSNFVIWSNLKSAFHSFIRDLEELNYRKILTEDLIISNNYYFIFNGNVIGPLPYNIELLTIITTLMTQNPDKIFYIKGNAEYMEEWRNLALKDELKKKASYLSKNKIPHEELVNNFFSKLPLALYLEHKNQFIRFAGLSADKQKNSTNSDAKDLKAIIKNINLNIEYKPTYGLNLLIPDKGITSWNILSSPIEMHQEFFSFYYDNFVILNISEDINSSKISLNYQDVREKTGFKVSEFNLLSGLPYKKKINTKNPIVLGCTLDLSETSRALGFRLQEGLMLGINKENLAGGIHDQFIKLIFLNDKYSPHLAQKNVNDLIENYNTELILAPLGTPTLEAYLSLVESKKILVLFPYTGAEIYRKPQLDNIINFRASYANEAESLIYHAINSLQMRRFAIFYQDDSYGQAGLEGARKALADFADVTFIEISYLRNNPNVELASKKIIEFNPDILILISTHAVSAALVNMLGLAFLANKIFMGISFLTDTFGNFLQEKGLPFFISRVVPSLESDVEIVKEYKEDMQKEYGIWRKLTYDSLEGYINARLFCDIARRIQGPITKEKLIEQFTILKNYNFKGLKLTYDPSTHELYKQTWISVPKKI